MYFSHSSNILSIVSDTCKLIDVYMAKFNVLRLIMWALQVVGTSGRVRRNIEDQFENV